MFGNESSGTEGSEEETEDKNGEENAERDEEQAAAATYKEWHCVSEGTQQEQHCVRERLSHYAVHTHTHTCVRVGDAMVGIGSSGGLVGEGLEPATGFAAQASSVG